MTTFLVVVLVLALVVIATFAYIKWINVVRRKSQEDITKLKDASSYLQSFITVLAFLIGACWAGYTWVIQWTDHVASVTPTLQETVFAKQVYPPGTSPKDGLFIGGWVAIKNVGNKLEYLRLADAPLFVARIKPESIPVGLKSRPKRGQDGRTAACLSAKMEFDEPRRFLLSRPIIDGRQDIFLGDQIRAGVTDEFHFIVKVSKPGMYAVIFSAEEPLEKEQSDTANGPQDWGDCEDKDPKVPQQFRWESPTYFVPVEDSAQDTSHSRGELHLDHATERQRGKQQATSVMPRIR